MKATVASIALLAVLSGCNATPDHPLLFNPTGLCNAIAEFPGDEEIYRALKSELTQKYGEGFSSWDFNITWDELRIWLNPTNAIDYVELAYKKADPPTAHFEPGKVALEYGFSSGDCYDPECGLVRRLCETE